MSFEDLLIQDDKELDHHLDLKLFLSAYIECNHVHAIEYLKIVFRLISI